MFNYKHYVPVLKWKQGEYQALYRLSNTVKDSLTPLIEIPNVGYDHEEQRARESIDDHLGDFGRRLRAKRHTRPCFVDTKYIPSMTRMHDGRHFIERVFELARANRCQAIPAVGLSMDAQSLAATATVIRTDQNGAALRLIMTDFDRPNLMAEIGRVLTAIGIGHADTDLIIDMEAPNFQPVRAFVRMTQTLLAMIPALNRWRTFTIVGTSYPASVSGLASPFEVIPRQEWIVYQNLIAQLDSGDRIPTFGDYATAHPEPVYLDMRLIDPYAKLRYTFTDYWHIGKGTPVKAHGYSQYRGMCQLLMTQPYFDGRGYSAGDDYIVNCAAGTARTGNLSTWVWVSTNRHLTKMVNDLATFHGLLDTAE